MPLTSGNPERDPSGGEAALGAAVPSTGSAPSGTGDLLRLIAFSLGAEWYALEASRVRGIEAEAEITPVPRAPEWLLGVFNLHGAILPVVDPRPLFQSSRRGSKGKGLFIIFHWEGNAAALRVDTVDEIYEVHAGSVEPQPAASEGERTELIVGQVRVRDHLIGVVDTTALVRALTEG